MKKVRGADAALSTPLTGAEQRRLLGLYRAQFGDDPPLPAGTPDSERVARTAELALARLVETTVVPDDEVRVLARNRGTAIVDYLVTQANVAKERVFLVDPNTAADANGDAVRSELKLAIR
jgi:hypothetical protein